MKFIYKIKNKHAKKTKKIHTPVERTGGMLGCIKGGVIRGNCGGGGKFTALFWTFNLWSVSICLSTSSRVKTRFTLLRQLIVFIGNLGKNLLDRFWLDGEFIWDVWGQLLVEAQDCSLEEADNKSFSNSSARQALWGVRNTLSEVEFNGVWGSYKNKKPLIKLKA